MGFNAGMDQEPSDISEVVGKDDYIRVQGNSTDSSGRVKAINPQIAILQPHIEQLPNCNYESVDFPEQVPIPGHTVKQITEDHYKSFEHTHLVNEYIGQFVHVQGKGQSTVGQLQAFHMNRMTFQPYLSVGSNEERVPVDKPFKREYSEDMTIEPVPESAVYPERNIVIP